MHDSSSHGIGRLKDPTYDRKSKSDDERKGGNPRLAKQASWEENREHEVKLGKTSEQYSYSSLHKWTASARIPFSGKEHFFLL